MATDDRVALVTGAARAGGIGAAIAQRLAADGLRVVAHGLPGEGGEIEADFADPAAPRRVADAVRAAHGRLDVVIANHARSSDVALDALDAAEIDATLAVNVRASLLLAREVARGAGRPRRAVHLGPAPRRDARRGRLRRIQGARCTASRRPWRSRSCRPRSTASIPVRPIRGSADEQLRDAVAAAAPGGRWGSPRRRRGSSPGWSARTAPV